MSRLVPVLAFLALVGPALAGCLVPDPLGSASSSSNETSAGVILVDGVSAPRFAGRIHEEFDIPTHDGLTLRADVWRPDTEERVPVIVALSPYMASRKVETDGNLPNYGPYRFVLERLVPAGYAFAAVDLRGTRQSQGCIDLAGPLEQRDAGTVADHFGKIGWSTGKVGFIGKSYDGLTAQEALVSGSEHVATIVVEAPVTGWYPVMAFGGIPYFLWTPGTIASYALIDNFEYFPRDPANAPKGWLLSYAHQSCLATNLLLGDPWTGDKTPYFLEHDLMPHVGKARGSVFYVHGLQDLNAKPDNAVPWFEALDVPKKGYFWQAPHEWPTYDRWDGPEEWTGRSDFWRTVHRWFDHWLLGVPNGMDRELNVQVQDNLRGWRNESGFPPPDVVEAKLHLASGGKLQPTPGSGTATWMDGGASRAPEWFGRKSPQATAALTNLRFESASLAADLRTSGVPQLRLAVSSTTPHTHFVANLYDVGTDGAWRLVNHGALALKNRESLEMPQPGVPGTTYEVTLSFQPQDYVFAKGHKVALLLKSEKVDWWIPSGTVASNTLTFGDDSALVLPSVDRAPGAVWLRSWGSKQVETLGRLIGDDL